MAGTGKKILVGCGIGCGLILVLNIVCGTGAGLLFRGVERDFEQAMESQTELERSLGSLTDYVPAPDGAVAPDRMRIFLGVRDSLTSAIDALAEAFAAFDEADEEKNLRTILGAIGAGIGLGPKAAEFLGRRNSALSAAGMGFGEYAYIYAVSYYGLLGEDPENDPTHGNLQIRSEGRHGLIIETESDTGVSMAVDRYRRVMLSSLRKRWNALDAMDPGDMRAGQIAMKEELGREVEELTRDGDRLPFADGLPAAIARSLEPFRSDLRRTWRAESNFFELARVAGDDDSFTVE